MFGRVDVDPFAVFSSRSDEALESPAFQLRIEDPVPVARTFPQQLRMLRIADHRRHFRGAEIIIGVFHFVAATHDRTRFGLPSQTQIVTAPPAERMVFDQFIRPERIESAAPGLQRQV